MQRDKSGTVFLKIYERDHATTDTGRNVECEIANCQLSYIHVHIHISTYRLVLFSASNILLSENSMFFNIIVKMLNYK